MSTYDDIMSCLCSDDYDADGRRKLCTNVKVRFSLKFSTYGAAMNAFLDYFQIGEIMARKFDKQLTYLLHNGYFHSIIPADAKHVKAIHRGHGVRGMWGQSIEATWYG